jgi:hypothetical protein
LRKNQFVSRVVVYQALDQGERVEGWLSARLAERRVANGSATIHTRRSRNGVVIAIRNVYHRRKMEELRLQPGSFGIIRERVQVPERQPSTLSGGIVFQHQKTLYA